MVRYFLKFSYTGTHYRGLQKQIGAYFIHDTDSVQGALETALSTVIPKSLNNPALVLSSRTDAGVHALCNTCHVELNNKYDDIYNISHLKQYVNRYFTKCGHTIRLLDCIPVTRDFHARHSCKSRTYLYRFMIPKVPGEQRKPLAETIHTYHLRADTFDIDRAKHGTQLFLGKKDFTTFSKQQEISHTVKYVRILDTFTLEEAQSLMPFDPLSERFTYWHFTCKAKGFLYNQVRRMAGAVIALGLGKVTEKDITTMLQVPSHHNWNPRIVPLPPNGLYLLNVEYDPDDLKRCTIVEEHEQELYSPEKKHRIQSIK